MRLGRAMTGKKKNLGAALVFVVTLTIYGLTMPPGLTWAHDGADGGDLAVAVANLGVPHPPGYPTYVLLGRLFATVLPVRDIAFRLNLFSAVAAATASLLAYLLLVSLLSSHEGGAEGSPRTILISTCAALLFAFSPTFWSQAVITEVYALNALMVALILLLSSLARRGPSHAERVLPWLGLTFGLGLGNHSTLILMAPSVIILLWPRNHALRPSPGTIARAILAFLAGLCVYAYLPLSALRAPTPNWGNAATPRGFLWMISASAYRHYVFGLPLNYVPNRLSAWAAGMLTQFGIWGVLLGLTGLWRIAESDRVRALAEGLVFVLVTAYAIGYNTTDSYVYLIPAYLIFALWIGHGLSFTLTTIRHHVRQYSKLAAPALALIALLPAIPLLVNYSSVDLSSDVRAARYGADIMQHVPPGAAVISATDAHTFGLWYAQEISRPRPDVLVLDQDLLQYPWYIDTLRKQRPHLSLTADVHDQCALLDALLDWGEEESPVYLTDPNAIRCPGYDLIAEGSLYRVRTVAPR